MHPVHICTCPFISVESDELQKIEREALEFYNGIVLPYNANEKRKLTDFTNKLYKAIRTVCINYRIQSEGR